MFRGFHRRISTCRAGHIAYDGKLRFLQNNVQEGLTHLLISGFHQSGMIRARDVQEVRASGCRVPCASPTATSTFASSPEITI